MGAMRTTPSLASNVLLGLPELPLWISREAAAEDGTCVKDIQV